MDFFGPSFPFNADLNDTRKIHSKIHDKIPAKSTHVMKNGVAKSTLREEGTANLGFDFAIRHWDCCQPVCPLVPLLFALLFLDLLHAAGGYTHIHTHTHS